MTIQNPTSSTLEYGELLDVVGAAALLDVSKRTIYRLVKQFTTVHIFLAK